MGCLIVAWPLQECTKIRQTWEHAPMQNFEANQDTREKYCQGRTLATTSGTFWAKAFANLSTAGCSEQDSTSTDRLYLYGNSACTHPISLPHAAHMYLQDQSQAKRLYKSATRSSLKSRRCQHHFMVSSSASLIGEVLLVSLSPTSGALRYDANDSGGRRAQKQAGGRLLHREYQHISSSIAVVQGRS